MFLESLLLCIEDTEKNEGHSITLPFSRAGQADMGEAHQQRRVMIEAYTTKTKDRKYLKVSQEDQGLRGEERDRLKNDWYSSLDRMSEEECENEGLHLFLLSVYKSWSKTCVLKVKGS